MAGAARHPHGRRGAVLRPGHGALDLAPAWKRRLIKDFNHKTSLAQDLDRLTIGAARTRPEYQGVLAALGLRPEGRPRAGHRPALDRRHHRGRRPLGRRDRRPLPRAVGARRADLAAAGDARADREIPRGERRPDEAAAELRALARDAKVALDARSTCSRAAPAFSPRAASTSPASASPPASGRGLDYYTGFVFELLRSARALPGNWSPAAATTAANAAPRARRSRRSASRSGSSGSPP